MSNPSVLLDRLSCWLGLRLWFGLRQDRKRICQRPVRVIQHEMEEVVLVLLVAPDHVPAVRTDKEVHGLSVEAKDGNNLVPTPAIRLSLCCLTHQDPPSSPEHHRTGAVARQHPPPPRRPLP